MQLIQQVHSLKLKDQVGNFSLSIQHSNTYVHSLIQHQRQQMEPWCLQRVSLIVKMEEMKEVEVDKEVDILLLLSLILFSQLLELWLLEGNAMVKYAKLRAMILLILIIHQRDIRILVIWLLKLIRICSLAPVLVDLRNLNQLHYLQDKSIYHV